MCLPIDRSGPGSSTGFYPESGDVDVVDVQLAGSVDDTMSTLKKRVMSAGPPADEALCALIAGVMPYGDRAGSGVDGFSHAWILLARLDMMKSARDSVNPTGYEVEKSSLICVIVR